MRRVLRWAVAVIVVLHGLIHVLGAAKGFGWADVSQLQQDIGPAAGVVWLTAGLLVVIAGTLLAGGIRGWWVVGAAAVVFSQGVIITSWSDARAGSLANGLLLGAVVYGCAAQGPTSFHAQYRRLVGTALAPPAADTDVTEVDLAALPPAVASYVRRSGAVGRPRVANFRAQIHGRIRATAGSPWMSFRGEQFNTFGPDPSRLFILDATMFGLPVDVLHTYLGPTATMRVKACSLLPIVNLTGPEMDRSETVTMFNDLCLLAPAALISAPITWRATGEDRVRGTFTNGAHTVSAELVFNHDDELVDFFSDDRQRASQDGKSFLPQRWSTPVRDYLTLDSRRRFTYGEGRWHAPEPEGEFTYIEFHVDEITYNAPAGRPATHDAGGTVNTSSQWLRQRVLE